MAEIATASNACVCGPPTAAGMAADAGWDHLITPAILAGSLGFAIANIAGVAITSLLSRAPEDDRFTASAIFS